MASMKTFYIYLCQLYLLLYLTGCDRPANNEDKEMAHDSNTSMDNNSAMIDNTVLLTIKNSDKYGRYIADNQGRSLYLSMADSAIDTSTCTDQCAKVWPPLTSSRIPEISDNLQSDLVGSLRRANGKMQVTYGGWPLYYYINDENPGDTKGQDVIGSGVKWYLISPEGNKVEG